MGMDNYAYLGPVLFIKQGCRKFKESEDRIGCNKCVTQSQAKFCGECGSENVAYAKVTLHDYTLNHLIEDCDLDEDDFRCDDYSTDEIGTIRNKAKWDRWVVQNHNVHVDEDVGFTELDFDELITATEDFKSSSTYETIVNFFGEENVQVKCGISVLCL